jgi:N-acetylmuramoyl-L-alanine amidase
MEIFRSIGRASIARALLVVALLMIPAQAANAEIYVVRAGDTLTSIAARNHVSPAALARANRILNRNLVRIGSRLVIPRAVPAMSTFSYYIHPGDTLSGLSYRFHVSIPTIRSLNPQLSAYPLYGEWLRLCSNCTGGYAAATSSSVATNVSTSSGTIYIVRPGDSLSAIAARFGTTVATLMASNALLNPNKIYVGARLTVRTGSGWTYDPWEARSLIVTYANYYGLDPSLPLAVAWQESGFNQTLTSKTGAIGVMQVEPYTGVTIERLWGQRINLYDMTTNIHAGVYWLGHLLSYYGGNERLAVAAYYEGTRSIARFGFFSDTVQYVADVLALQSRV